MKKLMMLVLVAAVVGLVGVSVAKAQTPNAPKAEPMIVGKVVVVKDASGVITAVQIENRRLGIFNVIIDAKGKELGEKMDGKLVSVKGVESTKDGKKWLTVESYKEIQRSPQDGGRKGPGGDSGKDKK